MRGKNGALFAFFSSFLLQVSSSYEKIFIVEWLFGDELALLFFIQGKTLACKLGLLAVDEGWERKVVSMFLNLVFMDASLGREGSNPQTQNLQAQFRLLELQFYFIYFYVSIIFLYVDSSIHEHIM
jgi:hypothetical protein